MRADVFVKRLAESYGDEAADEVRPHLAAVKPPAGRVRRSARGRQEHARRPGGCSRCPRRCSPVDTGRPGARSAYDVHRAASGLSPRTAWWRRWPRRSCGIGLPRDHRRGQPGRRPPARCGRTWPSASACRCGSSRWCCGDDAEHRRRVEARYAPRDHDRRLPELGARAASARPSTSRTSGPGWWWTRRCPATRCPACSRYRQLSRAHVDRRPSTVGVRRRNSWPRIRHQAGMSSAAAGSSASTRTTVADRQLRQPPGQRDHRQRAALAAAVEHAQAACHSPATPASARRSATTAGQLGQEPVDLRRCGVAVQRDPDVAVGQHAHRLQHVARAAASTDVHDEPDDTAKPRRSRACSSASPSTYRQENVTRCGSRSTGSPTTSTSGTVAATVARIRSTSADSRARLGRRPRRAPPAAPPRPPRPPAGRRAPGRLRPRRRPTGCPCAPPARPTPGGPPHLRALAGQQRPARRAPARARPTAPRRRSSGTPGRGAGRAGRRDRLHRADLVARADQRGQRHARARRTAAAPGVQVDPPEPVDGYRTAAPPAATCARGGVQHRGVLDRRVHERAPGPRAGRARPPSDRGADGRACRWA